MKVEQVTEDDLDYLKFRRSCKHGCFSHDPKSWQDNPRKLEPKECYCGIHGHHHSNLKKKNIYWIKLRRRMQRKMIL